MVVVNRGVRELSFFFFFFFLVYVPPFSSLARDDADDDSEPILGLWFEETISPSKEKVAPPPPPPPPPLETSPRLKSPSKQAPGENGNILASRKDPELVRAASARLCAMS